MTVGRRPACAASRRRAVTSPGRQSTHPPRERPNIRSAVTIDFEPSPGAQALQAPWQRLIDDRMLPSMAEWHRWADAGVHLLDGPEPLKETARSGAGCR